MRITAKQYAQVLYDTLIDATEDKIAELIEKFALILLENNQLSQLDKVIYFFEQIWNKNQGVVTAQVISAHPLEQSTKDLIKQYLSKISQAEIEFTAKVESRIKGGFIMRYGDKSIDYSLQNRLRQLKTTLIK